MDIIAHAVLDVYQFAARICYYFVHSKRMVLFSQIRKTFLQFANIHFRELLIGGDLASINFRELVPIRENKCPRKLMLAKINAREN